MSCAVQLIEVAKLSARMLAPAPSDADREAMERLHGFMDAFHREGVWPRCVLCEADVTRLPAMVTVADPGRGFRFMGAVCDGCTAQRTGLEARLVRAHDDFFGLPVVGHA